jgi:hypothetical protein
LTSLRYIVDIVEMKTTASSVKIADQVWAVTALLHREEPEREDFSVEEIMARARREPISQPLRPSFHVHVVQHCVANRRPNPGRWRMLVESGPGRRRLYRPGDPYDPAREGARALPGAGDLPAEYRELLTWYRAEYARPGAGKPGEDALLALRGSGRALWADEPADAYVERLRAGWG